MTPKTVDEITFPSWEPIHKAAYCGNYDMLLSELDNGICANHLVNNFESKHAARCKRNLTIYFDNMSPLYLAAQQGHYKCVRLLLDRGADPDVKCRNRYSNSECVATDVSFWRGNLKCYRLIRTYKRSTTALSTSLLNSPLTKDRQLAYQVN